MPAAAAPQQRGEFVKLTPSKISIALKAMYAKRRPVFLWGPPGCAKSDTMKQAALESSIGLIDVRAVTLDPTDIRGFPGVSNGKMIWYSPGFLPTDGVGIVFADELNRAPALVQNAFLQLALDRRIGDYHLPPGWVVFAAGNYESDGGGVTKLNAALSNRFVHLAVDTNCLPDWCKWAVQNGIEAMVIAFLRSFPQYLYDFDPKQKAFPSFRSWSFVSDVLTQNLPGDIEMAAIDGTVGHGAAVAFCSYAQMYRNIPSLDTILLNPDTAQMPSNAGEMFAVSCALARRTSATNFSRVLTYAARLGGEYEMYIVKDAVRRDNTLAHLPDFNRWAQSRDDWNF
jgi:hypothetical protein